MKKMIICFDIDNTICKTKANDYQNAKPYKRIINKINDLYDRGYFIKLHTSRYMGRNNEDVNKVKKQGYLQTKKQLKKWKLKFHQLIMGKPSFDLLIDDKSIDFKKNWIKRIDNIIKKLEK
tara:strand:- start:1549 stop:1911 length:363 start_codon:yes stop_codon:yes gene_type:complete